MPNPKVSTSRTPPSVELTENERKEHLALLERFGDFPVFSYAGKVKPTDKTVRRCYEVTFENGHKYPILPGDLLTGGGGYYSKHAPGLAVTDLKIPDEEIISWQEYVDAVRGTT